MGESISIEMMLKDKTFDLTHLEIAFSVLLRKVKEDGTMSPFDPSLITTIINEHSKIIKVVDVYNVLSFFLSKGANTSSKGSKGFSMSVTPPKNIQQKVKKSLTK